MTVDPELVNLVAEVLIDQGYGTSMKECDASTIAAALDPHIVMRSQYAVLNESAVDASSRAFESARKAVAAEARAAELQSALAEWDAGAARWEDQIRALRRHVLDLFHDGEPRQVRQEMLGTYDQVRELSDVYVHWAGREVPIAMFDIFHDGEPRQDGTQPTLQLTELGKLAYRYGALTPPQWWKDLFNEVKQLADEDRPGWYDVLFEERIAGLREMHQNIHKLIASDGTQDDR